MHTLNTSAYVLAINDAEHRLVRADGRQSAPSRIHQLSVIVRIMGLIWIWFHYDEVIVPRSRERLMRRSPMDQLMHVRHVETALRCMNAQLIQRDAPLTLRVLIQHALTAERDLLALILDHGATYGGHTRGRT